MEQIFILLLVTASSMTAYWWAKTRVTARSIRQALQMLVDCAGAFTMFFIFNLLAGASIILLIRSLTPVFVPLYTLDNFMLPILSAAQGIVFRFWWRD